MLKKADIGLIGLAVMGENLVLNMKSKGFTVAVYNRSADKTKSFMERQGNEGLIAAYSMAELADSLQKPRKVILMVKAGQPVDDFIEALLPHFEKGDIIIDGGNSYFKDTIRRAAYVESKGLLYMGTGVSGGEEGALKGPSIMPGGSREAWTQLKPILQSISAKVAGNVPCCDYVGPDGAGHFVKMIHNGIEYGDMQIICEAYQLLKTLLGCDADALHEVFEGWRKSELESYLIDITAQIFVHKEDGTATIDKILDVAGQKGTGKWASAAALDEGAPLTLINEAVFARYLSAQKDERSAASRLLTGPALRSGTFNQSQFIADVKDALFASKIISYAQGFVLMKMAAQTYGWSLNYGEIALMWRGGCIIRSSFLDRINDAFGADAQLANLLVSPFFRQAIEKAERGWRNTIITAVGSGIAVPAMSSALSYYDGYRCERSPANLLQAQRDFFGAHTYERTDRPRGEFYHTNWTGEGGVTASSTYNA